MGRYRFCWNSIFSTPTPTPTSTSTRTRSPTLTSLNKGQPWPWKGNFIVNKCSSGSSPSSSPSPSSILSFVSPAPVFRCWQTSSTWVVGRNFRHWCGGYINRRQYALKITFIFVNLMGDSDWENTTNQYILNINTSSIAPSSHCKGACRAAIRNRNSLTVNFKLWKSTMAVIIISDSCSRFRDFLRIVAPSPSFNRKSRTVT